MDILESKEIILNEINKIFIYHQELIKEYDIKEKELNNEKELINHANHRLIQEVAEKDKILFVNEKKFLDYEIMINKIQDEALKEVDEKTKHDMLRAQDKEIHDRDVEIQRLQKKIDSLEKGKECIKDKNDQWKGNEKNSFQDDDEKVKVAIEAYRQHLGNNEDVSIDKVGKTSIGINGWYEEGIKKTKDKKLVDKMKEITSSHINGETKEEDPNMIYEGDRIKEVIKEIEIEKEDVQEESESEEEPIVCSIIKHYGKEYYIIEGESPQYIYSINNGELGEKKGEIKNGKKIMNKKN